MATIKRRHSRHLPAFILLILAKESLHGGAIHSRLSDTLHNFTSDTGAVYRSLQDLENNHSLESDWDTSQPGPAKKIYRITKSGLDELDAWSEEINDRLADLLFFKEAYDSIRPRKES